MKVLIDRVIRTQLATENHTATLTPAAENTANGLRVETKDRERSLTNDGHEQKTNSTWGNKISLMQTTKPLPNHQLNENRTVKKKKTKP